MKQVSTLTKSIIITVAIVLFLCVTPSLLNVSAKATGVVDSGAVGGNMTWVLYSDGLLEINGTGAMSYDWPPPWYTYRDEISVIAIGDGITDIITGGFSIYDNLTRVTIPEGVTNITHGLFFGCISLETVELPRSVTYIGDGAFSESGIRSVYFRGAPPSYIGESIDNLYTITLYYYECMPFWTTSTWMGYTSQAVACPHNDDHSSLLLYSRKFGADFEYQFYLDGLMEISGTGDMPDYDDFYRPPWLSLRNMTKSVVIYEGVTSVGSYAFYEHTNIESLILPESLTKVGWSSFTNCRSLQSLIIPDSVRSIGAWAFSGCGITELIMNGASIELGENAFSVCSDLIELYLPNIQQVGFDDLNWYVFSGCRSLKSVSLPCATTIGEGAFYGCRNLETVYAPNVRRIGSYSFVWCTSLESISLPNAADIGSSAFSECANLKDVFLPIAKGINYSTFAECNSLTTISLPCVRYIDYEAFSGCSNLEYIYLPDVFHIDEIAFKDCTSLETVTLPKSIWEVGDYAFYRCSSLRAAIFEGDAPYYFGNMPYDSSNSVFALTHPDFKIYYYEGATGWTNPWNGYPTEMITSAGQKVVVSDAAARAGEEFTLTVQLKNVPGVASYGITMEYDPDVFTYISATPGEMLSELFRSQRITDSEINFNSYNFLGEYEPGELLFTIRMKINPGVEEISEGALRFYYFSFYDGFAVSLDGGQEPVVIYPEIDQPEFTLIPILPGDINGDGVVDRADQALLNQLFSRVLPLPLPDDLMIIMVNADINGDGVVDRADQTRLNQYFARINEAP